MIKLNLGCGVYTFPLDRDDIPNPEHLGQLPDFVFEPGWTNIDKHFAHGVQEKINLFRFPWIRSSNGNPYNDDSVDLIWAAHILEHVPHQVRPVLTLISFGSTDEMCEDYDGFFVFLTECWRILKPDGSLFIRSPYATCYPSLVDPTHTRYLVPGSFSYVSSQHHDGIPYDYDVPCQFEQVGPVNFRTTSNWTSRASDYNEMGFMNLIRSDYSVVDEFQIELRAVKE